MVEMYESFLRLLDNSQLIEHIHGLSQGSDQRHWSFDETSTPAPEKKVVKLDLVRSTESDPFDDDLDSFLLKFQPDKAEDERLAPATQEDAVASSRTESNEEIPGNQLAGIKKTLSGDSPEDSVVATNDAAAGDEVDDDAFDDGDTTMFADVGPLHEFGDYGTYFQNKHLKQQKADAAYIEWEKQRRAASGEEIEGKDIFAGCVIFVNGNTVPSLGVIHKLVILHGGVFLNYLTSKGAATHIVCDKLTPRKRIQLRNYRVVRAQWVADCVKEKKLLNWRDYRLIDDVDYDQKRLGFAVADETTLRSEELAEVEGEEHFHLQIEEQVEHEQMKDGLIDSVEVLEHDEMKHDDGLLEGEHRFEDGSIEETAANESSDPMDASSPKNSPHARTQSQMVELKLAQDRSHTYAMDAKHPDFLKHFFANSRLHHLSTWKADLRARFLRMVAKRAQEEGLIKTEVKEAAISKPSSDNIVLHIDFDCFFALASALSHPELDMARDPIAVSHGGKSSDVASCNYVARKLGVSNGMWLGRARERCPHLKVIDYDFNTYEKHSNSFYNYLLSKKVFDSIFPILIDEALVDATSYCKGKDASFIEDLCQEIRKDIHELTKCTVSVGASKNVLLAKLATKEAKPNGFFHLHKDIEEHLEGCKLMDLPNVGWHISEKLANELRLDVNPKELMIKDVKSLTQKRLTDVLGEKLGRKVFELCRGIDHTSILLDLSSSETLLGRKTVSVDVNFGIRFDTFDQAEFFLMQLARELHKRLIALGVCGSVLTLKLARRAPDAPRITPKFLGLGICDFFSRSSRLGVPTNDWGILGSEMKALFRVMNIPVEDLRGVAVSVGKLEDVDVVKKQRQQRLEFNKPRDKKVAQSLQSSQLNPYADSVTGSDSIDWNVFNMLPEDIKRELKRELLRRGIPVSNKEVSPTKKLSASESGGKVYLQQMFPTQANGPFKVTRVIESPKKKKKLGISPKKSMSPVKPPLSPTPFNETVSYDEDVLGEIPTLIREEFFKDLAWQRKNKKLNPVSMRDMIEKKNENMRAIGDSEINVDWLRAQRRAMIVESITGECFNLEETIAQVKDWVRLSVAHRGPHPDDVSVFTQYLISLASQGNINLCAAILRHIEAEIQVQNSILNMCKKEDKQSDILRSGIEDWQNQFHKNLKGALLMFLSQKNIKLRY